MISLITKRGFVPGQELRGVSMNRNAVIAGIVATLALGLVGCGGPDDTQSIRKARLDDVKHIAAKKAVTKPATRAVIDYHNQCQTKFRTVTRTTGTGTSRRTSVSQESYQDCNRIQTGSHQESYTKTIKAGKPARWCVELDDVNGSRDADDQWFTVSRDVYIKWADRREGSKVKHMEYTRKGC